jgi:hypothetical protein
MQPQEEHYKVTQSAYYYVFYTELWVGLGSGCHVCTKAGYVADYGHYSLLT